MTFWILRGFTLAPCKFGPLLEEILATPLLMNAAGKTLANIEHGAFDAPSALCR